METTIVKWQDFERSGEKFGLNHLQPRTIRFERPGGEHPSTESYQVDVEFTSHCFTRAPRPDERYDAGLVYPDTYELRLFDRRRYQASLQLPEIIRALPSRKIRQNRGQAKYFTVELILEDGCTIEYDIFFKLRKAGKGRLQMIVETAYIRETGYASTRPSGRPIGFWIILYNTLHEIPIRS